LYRKPAAKQPVPQPGVVTFRHPPIIPAKAQPTALGLGLPGLSFTAGSSTQFSRDATPTPYQDYQRDGIGQLRINVSALASTIVTIEHTLGRIPNRIEVLTNGGGLPTCGYTVEGPWTAAVPLVPGTVVVSFPTALDGATVWLG
jgi:hypothetical protein